MHGRRLSVLVLPALGFAGLVAANMDTAFAQSVTRQLTNLIEICSKQHAYSTSQSEALGEHELGAEELAWRSCVYAEIREKMIPNSPLAAMYGDLIKNDEAMTAQIGEKKLTRKERRVTNLRAIMAIQEEEKKHLAEREKELRDLASSNQGARDAQQILDQQRRIFEINRSALEGLR